MLKHTLKLIYRNFIRFKSSFFINLVGLSVGMACTIFILLWVMDELNVDRYHSNVENIYQVMENQEYAEGSIHTTTETPGILAPALKEEIPEIEYATTYTWNVDYLFRRGDKSLKENGIFAREDLFNILSIPLISGNEDELLTAPYSVVISEELAKKYFADESAVGKSIDIDDGGTYTITGVFSDISNNSTLQFNFVLPFEEYLQQNEWAADWANNSAQTIVMLRPEADVKSVDRKIKHFVKERSEQSDAELFLYPYADSYLYGSFDNGESVGGRIAYVRLFSVIAFFILLIACINFMNLSTARSSRRAKEVGIRKSIGAGRGSLIGQYMGESIITAFSALGFSLLIVELGLPIFNEVTEKTITIQYTDPSLLLFLGAIAFITGLISGSYPALYLSSFEAAKALKGKVKSSNREAFARKGLVVFQFTMSIILIVSTIVIYKQIEYFQQKNLGYKQENLIAFPIEGDLADNWESFSKQVQTEPGVESISSANHNFLGRYTSAADVHWPGKDPDANVLFELILVDYALIETFDFELAEGRSFSREYGADSARVIVNEAAVKVMGMDQPVGKTLDAWYDDSEIIGVLKDFNYQNFQFKVEPIVMILNGGESFGTNFGYMRLKSDNISRTLADVEQTYKKFNPDYPFDYSFMDEQFAALYRSEMKVGELAKYFGIFAILISCLGLFGLSIFMAEQRTKEIGVRKVMGATVTNIVGLMSKDFMVLVLLGFVCAVPIAWYLMNQWLADYAYRIDIGPGIFVIAGGVALLIALVTVSWQSIKAALMNPVKSLRSE